MCKLNDELNMESLVLNGSLFMGTNSEFKEAKLSGAKIGGQLIINKSTFKGNLIMFSLEVNRDLVIRENVEFSDLNLACAKIGNLFISGCTFLKYSDFSEDEFKLPFTAEKLFNAVNNDKYNLFLNSANNTIFWLNELLKTPNFYDILCTKKPNRSFSEYVISLVNKTNGYRNNKNFSDLDITEQSNIKRLNRFLLEETYFQETPKNQFSKLSMRSLKVRGFLQIEGDSEFGEVDLLAAEVGEQLIINRANFKGPINMNSIEVKRDIVICGNLKFFEEVDLSNAKIGQLNISNNVIFIKKLNMASIHIDGYLSTEAPSGSNTNPSQFNDLDLTCAKIGEQLIFTNATFKDKLTMDSIEVKRDILMRGNLTFFREVDIHNANIGRTLDIRNAKFYDNLNIQSLEVKGSLSLLDNSMFGKVNLSGSKIGTQLILYQCRFKKKLDMESIETDDSLVLVNNLFRKQINMPFIRINKNLDISQNERFPSLNLTSAQIKGELKLKYNKDQFTCWKGGATLILINAEVGFINDSPESWPHNLELDGFTYTYFGGISKANELYNIADRDFEAWLKKQKHYSRQPYEQLASILQKAGYKGKASDILYESKERERKEIAKGWYKLWLFLLNWLIGYGLGLRLLYLPLFWVMIFTVIGMFCINKHKKEKERFIHKKENVLKEKKRYILLYSCWNSWYLWCFFYSFDILLPLFKLDEQHNKIELEGCQKYYFYFHKIFGFTLASFIIAGITGLTR